MCRLRQNSMLARGFHLRPDGAHSLSFFISVFVDDFNPTHDVLIELCQLFCRDPILLVLGTTEEALDNRLDYLGLRLVRYRVGVTRLTGFATRVRGWAGRFR